MTHEQAANKDTGIIGKIVNVSKNGGGLLVKNGEVTDIIPPISKNASSFGLKFKRNNKVTGINPDDHIEIVG